MKIIAFYLPQFHVIPENDQWWGKGFTDWVNVKKARPQYFGHYQPRIPFGKNYYDLSSLSTIKWQIDLARSYGIHGFCHYHYWFEGKQLLETPTNLFLSSPNLDHAFCLAWANATWSRTWDWNENKSEILIKQTHIPECERWKVHFNYLIRAWEDKRAIRINNKPIFLIYRPHAIDQVGDMLSYWREMAAQRGLPGVYFIAMQQHRFLSNNFLKHYDAVVKFQPSASMFIPQRQDSLFSRILLQQYLRSLPPWAAKPLKQIQKLFPRRLRFHEYDELWARILTSEPNKDIMTYPGAFLDWDNTARYANRARIVRGGNPERFRFWFKRLVDDIRHQPEDHRVIFLNAWNEWAEGTYLEPDERYGIEYLEAVKSCIA